MDSYFNFVKFLRCPITKNNLSLITIEDFSNYSLEQNFSLFGEISLGLIDNSKQYFYPIFEKIFILLEEYAIYLGKDNDVRGEMSTNKKRVFDYYNTINYSLKDSLDIYEDSYKWVDYRDVSSKYIKNSFKRASKYYPKKGEFLLDIASGPIGLPEYINLSEGYDYRICVDISIKALLKAKKNLESVDKKGIYICGDITNIPLKDLTCDTVLSQHTLYHVPKNSQSTAVNEMYRVAKLNSKIVIVYNWFYYSSFMNLSLNLIQLYRISRYVAGRLYVKFVKKRKGLYYYVHSPKWFKKTFEFSGEIEFYCWRSTNKYFLDLFIHKLFFGEKILNMLIKIEDRYSKLLGKHGDYPVIVIDKKM